MIDILNSSIHFLGKENSWRSNVKSVLYSKDKSLILIGEGINDPKGIFGTTSNLSKKYGKNRVIESPISENGITGISIGLAINNFKVLLIHQRVEFALLSIEQIFNNAAKSFYVRLT